MYKNLLVTGAAGFIGSNFIKYLNQNEYEGKIVIVDNLTYAGTMSNLSMDDLTYDEFYKTDICNIEAINRIFAKEKIDAIINFAAESHVDRSIASSLKFIETNVVGTETLLSAARTFNVKRFLQVSTDEVYGSLSLNDPSSTENSPIKPSSPYSASKAAADLLVNSYHVTHGLNTIITRCSNNYGPKQHPEKLIPLIITRALKNLPLPVYGNGLNIRDWIDVSDHCNGIWRALNHGVSGEIYNFGGDNQTSNLEIINTILEHLKKSSKLIEFVKDRPGHDLRYDINSSKAKKNLQWKPLINLRDGLQDTINWYITSEKLL